MAKQNRTTLKGYFETGDIPSQTQYADLIDSKLNLAETGVQVIEGTISSSVLESSNNIVAKTHITASGNISASGNVLGNFFYSNEAAALGFTGGTIYLGNALHPTEIDGSQLSLSAGPISTGNTFTSTNYISATHITASGNISSSMGTGSFGSLVVDGSSVDFSGLPTSDPGVAGRLYNDSGTIKISL